MVNIDRKLEFHKSDVILNPKNTEEQIESNSGIPYF